MTTLRLLLLFFCALVFADAQAQQLFNIRSQHKRDSKKMQSLKDDSERLPERLEEIIATLDTVRISLEKSNRSREKNSGEGATEFIKVLSDVEEKNKSAIQAFNNAKIYYDKIYYDTLTDSHSASEFQSNREQFDKLYKESKAAFSEVRKSEKRAIRKVRLYFIRHYWSKEPLILNFVDKYYKSAIDGKKNHLTNLQRESKNLDDSVKVLNTRKIVLENSIESSQGTLENLREESNDIRGKIETLTRDKEGQEKDLADLIWRVGTEQKSLEGILGKYVQKSTELTKTENRIMFCNNSLDSIEREMASLGNAYQKAKDYDGLDGRYHAERNSAIAYREYLNDTIKYYNRALTEKDQRLEAAKKKGSDAERKKKDDRNLFIIIFLLFAALALGIISLIQHERMEAIKRGRRGIAAKNAELEEKNREVEEKNREVEEKNQQLEDKRKKLEDLVQRLHNSTEELNHRTKNNLQQVSAMLLMQEEETGDVEAKDALQDARSRIDVLGILHRLLYESQRDNYTKMELSQFIQKLTEHVVMANSSPKRRPKTHINVASIEVKMERAVQVGLVANELIQNCFKHAFKTTTTNPTLDVRLHTIGKDIELSIRDNGPGMPPGAPSIEESSSFGLKLVHLIVSGIGGTILCENDGGLVCKVVFPIDES